MRADAEQQVEVERAMMDEERWVLEEAIVSSAKQQARVEVMMVDRERQVEAEW